eukprot:TRINITY_DN3151_c0_g1_i1.p1 TRINITY_DN3151_c0_g1~~TRINITY_DN3151_c0_g1_i1.p1  ORF type:complete len:208 (-),score=12.45 TRINITY_DN3151_c0_g1_i1:51-674(-)
MGSDPGGGGPEPRKLGRHGAALRPHLRGSDTGGDPPGAEPLPRGGGRGPRFRPPLHPRDRVEHLRHAPEPPLQLGASAAAQSVAPHLLEAGFLASMARALRPGGTLLVVTDLRGYGEVLLSVCAEVCDRDPSLTPFQPTASYSVPCRKATAAGGVICLFRGQPGADCGITAPNASSYFRRLKDQEKAAWNAPDESLRYFLGIRKSSQ